MKPSEVARSPEVERSLKGKGAVSGIRIIYAYFRDDRALLIEMYFKGDQQNEDRDRIKHLCQGS